ncbi:MAG: T9SS type A sorting domain-containing protein [Gemmatimonadetes bacterium]|nr:T9SS type A sorting domain-containing protein [Gemmatimonadota bacterium]
MTSVADPPESRVFLSPGSPNPFGASTRLSFELPAPSRVQLRLYDAAGRLVRTLRDGRLPAGRHVAQWDGRDRDGRRVANGIYFAKLDAGGRSMTQRVVRLN